MELSEFGLNHGVDIEVENNTPDHVVPIMSLQDPEVTGETKAQDIFEEVVPGEVPELREDFKLVGDNVAVLEDFDYLLQDIARAKGMNQTLALEAKRLAPEFDSNLPIGFYSQHTSQTRYRPAMESILQQIKETFKKLIVKIREMLKRVALWLLGIADPSAVNKTNEEIRHEVQKEAQKEQDHADALAEGLEDISTMARVAEQEVQKGVDVQTPSGEQAHVSDFEKLADAVLRGSRSEMEYRHFVESTNPAFHDIINNGPWTQATEDLVESIPLLTAILRTKAAWLNNFVNDFTADRISEKLIDAAGERLDKIGDRLEIKFQGRSMNLQDAASQYNQIYQQVTQSEVSGHLLIEQVFTRMSHAIRTGPTRKLIEGNFAVSESLLVLEKYMDLLEKRIGYMPTDDSQYTAPAPANVAMRAVLEGLRQDARDLSLIANRMTAYRRIVNTVAMKVVGFAYVLAKEVNKSTTASSGDLPEIVRGIANRAGEMVKESHVKIMTEYAKKGIETLPGWK